MTLFTIVKVAKTQEREITKKRTICVLLSVYVFASLIERQSERERERGRKLHVHDERGGQRGSMLWSVLKQGQLCCT